MRFASTFRRGQIILARRREPLSVRSSRFPRDSRPCFPSSSLRLFVRHASTISQKRIGISSWGGGRNGFTLLEMVTSMGIFLVIVVSAIGVTIDIMNAQVRAAETQAIQDNVRFSLELITKELRTGFGYQNTSFGLNCVGSGFDPIHELTFTNSEGTQITYYWDSRPENLTIMRMSDSVNHQNCGETAYTQPLTSDEVRVKNLRFVLHGATRGSSDGQPIATIVLQVQSADPRLSSPVSLSLQTSIVPRLREF